jgi:hypothetical protein
VDQEVGEAVGFQETGGGAVGTLAIIGDLGVLAQRAAADQALALKAGEPGEIGFLLAAVLLGEPLVEE